MQEELTTLAIGTTIQGHVGDSYVIEEFLGVRGFGAVYLVRDRRVKANLFALKELIDPNKGDRERFVFEGDILKRLYHRALPRVYRVFEHNKLKRVYMLMDYVEGTNLETLRLEQPEQRFSLPLVLALMAPIVDALIYLHHHDPPIVHLDIKPANIIVPIKAEEAMLVDFGLAKEYMIDTITTAIRHGASGYTALEQYGKGTTSSTDIYGLGATFYTLLTGTVPIDAVSRTAESNGIDPLLPASLITPDVPTDVAKTLQRAMSISIDDRFKTIEEFWKELTAQVPQLETLVPSLTSFHTNESLALSNQVVNSTSSYNLQNAPRWRKLGMKLGALLPIIFALLLIGLIGTSFLLYKPGYGSHSSAPATNLSTAISAAPPSATPTPRLSKYPIIAPSYAGKVVDLMTGTQTAMYLTNIQQNQGIILGTFQGLGFTGTFKGIVTQFGNLQFKVTIWQGKGSLLFEGTIKVGGDIVGSFKVLDQRGNFTGESGPYNVASQK